MPPPRAFAAATAELPVNITSRLMDGKTFSCTVKGLTVADVPFADSLCKAFSDGAGLKSRYPYVKVS